jgi:hypothetical protein
VRTSGGCCCAAMKSTIQRVTRSAGRPWR